jgi:putative phosphoribosyl transferase
VVRKLGAPSQPELAIGALAQGGIRVLNEPLIDRLRITPEEVERVTRQEERELERRCRKYQLENRPPDLAGKTAILTDDGLATGMTAHAAIQALRTLQPGKLILAAPVGSIEAVSWLSSEVDQLVCPFTPPEFMAVGQWYRHFDQTDDAEVIGLLREASEKYPKA